MTPEKIGQYTIIDELGRGGMATVYLAKDPRFDREVALKVLPREFLHDPQFRVRFEREARTIAALEHSAIVPVYDVGEDEGQPYYVMRYMTGGSLSDRLKKGSFNVEQAAKVMQRLCSALDEAHAKGIVHRDLKPGNILFDKGGDPYISDFGIAKLTQSQTNVTGSAIVGTPSYISPEQAQGTPVDGRADIYALGTILFEMLSGRTPYKADTPMALVVKHITEPVPHILDFNPNLPVAIDDVIQKAMAKDREERFQTAGMLSRALVAVAAGETLDLESTLAKKTNIAKTRLGAIPPTAGQATAPTPARRFNPAFIWVPVVLFLFGLGLAGAALVGNRLLAAVKTEPTSTVTAQPVVVVLPSSSDTPTVEPAATLVPATAAPTVEPTFTLEPMPAVPTVGGADKIAFLANNDIWVMDPNGIEPVRLTIDSKAKSDLQWLPDGQTILYISGKCVKTVDMNQVEDVVTCFDSAQYLEAAQVSPDGSQLAIVLDRELYIIPFDLQRLSAAKNRNDLVREDICLTYTQTAVKEVRWSKDSAKIALIFLGVSGSRRVEMVHIFDISGCPQDELFPKDEFPGQRFDFSGLEMPDFDWDGDLLFLMNSNKRNDGFGYLYTYNAGTRKGAQLNPMGSCCYRDARFSPDGSFVIFAYQDERLGAAASIELYLLRFGDISAGGLPEPIPLPPGFFLDPRQKLQPAFRPLQP